MSEISVRNRETHFGVEVDFRFTLDEGIIHQAFKIDLEEEEAQSYLKEVFEEARIKFIKYLMTGHKNDM